MADPEASLEELSANLAEYEQQLEEISRMLLDDPENEEMQAIFENLSEVRGLGPCCAADWTACLRCCDGGRRPATGQHCPRTSSGAAAAATAHPPSASCAAVALPSICLLQVIQLTRELHQAQAGAEPGELREQHGQLAGPAAAAPAATAATAAGAGGAAAAPPTAASLLPTQMADHILRAQQRAGLTGQGPQAWAVGAKCRAVYSGDGNWWATAAATARALPQPSHS
jgi:hypothetical protein